MSNKKEISTPLNVDEARNLELDETPKPTRKASNPSFPVANTEESGTQDRIKGKRVIK